VIDEKMARALLAECELHAMIGLELTEWGDGVIAFRFAPPRSARSGEHSSVHGGVLATALDTAATFAIISSAQQDAGTVDLRIDYMRPAVDREFRVEGRTTRLGRTLGWADSQITTVDGRLIATARGTFVR
jgi:uncharacterized protein (TIGR00369 family)